MVSLLIVKADFEVARWQQVVVDVDVEIVVLLSAVVVDKSGRF